MSSGTGAVKIAAIVNSFNRRDLLSTSLQSLTTALQGLPFQSAIVVFDAGSNDGSIEWLRDYQSHSRSIEISVVVPEAGEDASFAAGVNAGCREAIKRYPALQYLFLFETDNLIAGSEPVAVATRLLDSHPDIGAAGFTVANRAGQQVGFGCSFPSALQFLLGQQVTAKLGMDRPKLTFEGSFEGYTWGTCDVVYTSPLLIRRETWEKTNGMDAAIFPYSDCDLDWCWRALHAGWKSAVIRLSGVVHDNGQQASGWSAWRVITFHRARLRLLQRHQKAGGILLRTGLLARHTLEFVALAVSSPALSNPKGSLKKRWRLMTSAMRGYLP